jgi:hypothetical protein
MAFTSRTTRSLSQALKNVPTLTSAPLLPFSMSTSSGKLISPTKLKSLVKIKSLVKLAPKLKQTKYVSSLTSASGKYIVAQSCLSERRRYSSSKPVTTMPDIPNSLIVSLPIPSVLVAYKPRIDKLELDNLSSDKPDTGSSEVKNEGEVQEVKFTLLSKVEKYVDLVLGKIIDWTRFTDTHFLWGLPCAFLFGALVGLSYDSEHSSSVAFIFGFVNLVLFTAFMIFFSGPMGATVIALVGLGIWNRSE